MKTRVVLLVGVAAGVIYANTPQGRRTYRAVRARLEQLWGSPSVQSSVNTIQKNAKRVPGIGPELSGIIKSTRPGR